MARSVSVADYSDKNLVGSTISNLWLELNSSRRGAMNLWKEVDAYRFATDTRSLEGMNHFDHSVHIPSTHMVDEKLGSILNATAFPHEDWLGWEALDRDALSVAKRDKVLAYLRKIHAQTKFTRTGKRAIDDLKAYGNCFAQTVFVNESREEDGKVVSGYVGPRTYRISPFDIAFDPTAPSWDDTYKIVHERKSIADFVEFAESNTELVNQDAIQMLLDTRRGGWDSISSNEYYKDSQFVDHGYESALSYLRSGFVDLLWFYGTIYDEDTGKVHRNRCIVVADLNHIIMDTHKPDPRIRKGSWKERPDNLWAQSPLEPVVGLNYMINHRENAKDDAIDRMIHPDKLYIGEVEIIHDEVTGRDEIWAPLNGDARDIAPDASTLSFNTEIDRIEQTIMEVVGLPSDILGFRSPGEKTAFEVQNITEGAFRGFIDHVAQWEQDFLEKVVADQVAVALDNFQDVQEVLLTNEKGYQIPVQVTKEDLSANATIVPKGARRFSRMLQQIASIQNLAQIQQLVGMHLDTYNLAKAIEQLGGLTDFKVVKKFAALAEQGEAQQKQAMVQQDTVSALSQPTAEELALEDEQG